MPKRKDVSIYLSYILRHHPEDIGLSLDTRGWANVALLIQKINQSGKYTLTLEQLKDIVANDAKGRYRFSADKLHIKACQGHSISWVEPEMEYKKPPEFLYHGTTSDAYRKIQQTGHIDKMKRHAVHLSADETKAWQSATRWHTSKPLLLKIAAEKMLDDGFIFGRTENEVWCIEEVPSRYICGIICEKKN